MGRCADRTLGDEWLEMLVKGARGKYFLRLQGSEVAGALRDVKEGKAKLYEAWYGPGIRQL